MTKLSSSLLILYKQVVYSGRLWLVYHNRLVLSTSFLFLEEHRQNYQDFIKKLDFFPLDTSEMFIEGFPLGARMMIEIFQNDVSDMEK